MKRQTNKQKKEKTLHKTEKTKTEKETNTHSIYTRPRHPGIRNEIVWKNIRNKTNKSKTFIFLTAGQRRDFTLTRVRCHYAVDVSMGGKDDDISSGEGRKSS